MLDLLLTIQYVFLLVFNLITSKVNLSYFDELLFLLLLFVSIVITIKNKKIMMSRTFICIAKYFLVILFIGLLSNICFNYCNNTIIIIKDIIINFKFIFTYLLGTYIFCNYKSKRLYRNILSISKIYLIIIFIFGIISMFANIGMGSDLRFGFRSYKFLYSHYTFLVFNVIILLSVISTSKKCLFYDIIGIVILIMTLRTKALMFATGYIFMKFATRKFNSNPIRKKINFKIIFPILLLIILVASPKIKLSGGQIIICEMDYI